MSTSAPVYVSKAGLSFEKLQTLPFSKMDRDWHRALVTPPIEFCLGLDASRLWFIARRSSAPNCQELPAGTFKEGLWEHDCAELFLCSDEGPEYLELNLSPRGAWWAASFSRYRQRRTAEQNLGATCWSASSSVAAWASGISIERAKLPIAVNLSSGKSRGNVTGVCLLGGAPQYLTYTELKAPQPDFHVAEQFLEFALKPIS